MKKHIGIIVFALAILAFLFFLSSRKKAPTLPGDEAHKQVLSNSPCQTCHGPGKQSPLKPSHPPKEQCLLCHKPRATDV
jgi:mono/diheme cytochrome c family protein